MPECDYCGKEITMPYTCGYCGDSFCSNHRLPENHECGGLEKVSEESRSKGRIYRGISEDLKTEPKRDRREDFESIPFDLSGSEEEEPFSISKWNLFKNFFLGNVTFLLILIMVISFIGQLLVFGLFGSSTYNQIMSWLTPTKSTFLTRPWTLVTSIFLHSIQYTFHLIFNALILLFIGPTLERMIGRNKFIGIFLVSGVVAGISQLLVPGPDLPLLGASGAIFGILGALTVMAPRMPILLFFFIPMQLWMLTLGYGFIEFILAILRPASTIAHIAHVGGLIAGLIFGYKFRRDREHKAQDFFKKMMGQ